MDSLARDLRHACRLFARSPGFTLVALLTLTLGIGANTAIFSVVNGVLLRALPYASPDRVVTLTGGDVDGTFGISELERVAYRERIRAFDRVGTYAPTPVNVTGGEAERVFAAFVDADVLPTLGVEPTIGRAFTPADDVPGGDDVALIGQALWQRRFGGRTEVLGQPIVVDGTPRVIVGILPPTFRLPTGFGGPRAEILMPLAPDPVPDPRNFHNLSGVARLADGVAIDAAREELAALSVRLREEIATLPPTFEARIRPVREAVLGDARPALLVLLGAVGLLLLIASANVANLFLARSEARRMETSIRSALGASRFRLIRQLLTECTLLALVAGALGLALAWWVVAALVRLSPPNLPRIDELGLDAGVYVFTLVVSLASAVLFGLAPALGVRERELQRALRDGGRSASGAGGRLRQALVVAETALAVMLAIGGALLVQSFMRLQAVDPGFDRDRLLTATVSLPSTGYPDKVAARRFYRDALEAVSVRPGVEAVGAINMLPMVAQPGDWGIRIEGREEERLASGRRPWGDWMVTTAGYFEAMGVRVRQGRAFSAGDTADAAPVVMINQTLANLYWPEGDALGKRFRMSSDIDEAYRTVIGIVDDVRHGGLDREARREFYLPHAQFPAAQDFPVGSMTLVVRTAGPPVAMGGSVRRVVNDLDPEVPVASLRSMGDVVETSTSVRRLNALLFGAFGLLGLALVTVGVYGVMAYTVTRRGRELGVRMALGASPGQVVRLIVGQGARLALVGVGTGLVASLALTRLLRGLLFGVGITDPGTFVVIPALLAAVTLAASYLPARRATRADPIAALRAE